MLMVVDRYAQGSRTWKSFNRTRDEAKEEEIYFSSLHLIGTEDCDPGEYQT